MAVVSHQQWVISIVSHNNRRIVIRIFFLRLYTEARTSWIMPFTAGGFLHIALVTVLPDLIKETDLKESMKQIAALIFGIAVMAIMTVLFE